MTSRTAPKLNSMVTKRETAWLMGKMNLGMYTFLISGAFWITEVRPMLVVSLKKVNRVLPQIR